MAAIGNLTAEQMGLGNVLGPLLDLPETKNPFQTTFPFRRIMKVIKSLCLNNAQRDKGETRAIFKSDTHQNKAKKPFKICSQNLNLAAP